MTPPTAATSRTIEVTSNASRWSVRNSVPIDAGEPNASVTSGVFVRSSPAARTITTTTWAAIAAAATTDATACQLGPALHGMNSRPPR